MWLIRTVVLCHIYAPKIGLFLGVVLLSQPLIEIGLQDGLEATVIKIFLETVYYINHP